MPICTLEPPANDEPIALLVAQADVVEVAKLIELTRRLDGPAADLGGLVADLCSAVDRLDAAEAAAAGDGELAA